MPLPIKEEPKTRKVMMLWTEKMYIEAKEFADINNISVSELSRYAINQFLQNNPLEES